MPQSSILGPCADPGIFQGCPTARKQSGILSLFSPQHILQFTEGVQWFYYKENCTFPRIQRGSNIFQGGGVHMLISIETHIICDFPRGSGPLSPWIHT